MYVHGHMHVHWGKERETGICLLINPQGHDGASPVCFQYVITVWVGVGVRRRGSSVLEGKLPTCVSL